MGRAFLSHLNGAQTGAALTAPALVALSAPLVALSCGNPSHCAELFFRENVDSCRQARYNGEMVWGFLCHWSQSLFAFLDV